MAGLWYALIGVVFLSSVLAAPAVEEVDPIVPPVPGEPTIEISSPAAPLLPNGELAVPDCKNTTDVYDLSQNGTENYKVNVKGFTFLLAGSDTVLGAAMLMSGMADKNNPAGAPSPANPATAEVVAPHSDKMSRLMTLIKQIGSKGRSINVNLLNNQEGRKQARLFLRNLH